MIRPENIRRAGAGTTGAVLAVRIVSTNYYGGATRLQLDVNGEQLVTHASFPFHSQPQAGDAMDIVIDTAAVRIIPAEA